MPDDRIERADRILDAAADLLTVQGYRRVTVDEVARRADVGKGTVYLHWRSRDDLLLSVLTREGARLMADCAAAIEADPREMLMHRYLRLVYLGTVRRPLLRAAFVKDTEVLGKMANSHSAVELGQEKALLSNDYLRLLMDNGLLDSDLPPEHLNYSYGCIVLGYLVAAGLTPADTAMPDEDAADVLAATLEAAFPPARKPSKRTLDALAPKIVDRLTELIRAYENHTYRHTGGGRDTR